MAHLAGKLFAALGLVLSVAFATTTPEAMPKKEIGEITTDPVAGQGVVGLIYQYASRYGIDFGLARTIAELESGFDPSARNPSSTAKGIFQFLDGTWKYCDGDVLNAEDNIRCAMRLLSEPHGIRHWLADPDMRARLAARGYVFGGE